MLPFFLLLVCIAGPVVVWCGWYDPGPWKQFLLPWPSPWIVPVVYALCSLLVCSTFFWVMRSGVFDIVALTLAQEALGFYGYFYLDQTAARLPDDERSILAASGLVVLFNAAGFLCLFASMAATYGAAWTFRLGLTPLPAPAAELDRRLVTFCRLASFFVMGAIALPMVLSHHIPLLSHSNAEARLEFLNVSDGARALYNLATALLPFTVGPLVMSIIGRWRRLFGWDGIGAFGMMFLQLLTSNRSTLLSAVTVTLGLVTMKYRWPRWLLACVFLGYIFGFTFLSGASSLLRNSPHDLLRADWFSRSMEEAFLGDNIIDVRDGSWVFGKWNYDPLLGKTYLGGLVSMMPSGLFPQKKQWHIGLTGVRIVGMPDDEHFGLRITFFGEAFLNFGWAGVVFLGTLMGATIAIVLREVHLATQAPCLWRCLTLMIFLRCELCLDNTADAFDFWSLFGFLALIWLLVTFPAQHSAAPLKTTGSLKPKRSARPIR